MNTKKKKKIVPVHSQHRRQSNEAEEMTPESLEATIALDPSTADTSREPVCYLLQDSQTQATLIEHYSAKPPSGNESNDIILAHWSIPTATPLPNHKYTRNFGKNLLCNCSKGDLIGKRAYYSGICQWLRSAKTWNGSVMWRRHVAGWECDIYVYFHDREETTAQTRRIPQDPPQQQPQPQPQTVLVKDGQEFPIYLADAVAIVPRGSDFLHYDPRFKTNIDKWVSEGSKLGFATKLDVRAGCAFGSEQRSHRAVGDAARPSGGASYNSLAVEYGIETEGMERSIGEAGRRRWEEEKEREQEELRAVKVALERGSKEMRALEENERNRVEKEKMVKEDVSKSRWARNKTLNSHDGDDEVLNPSEIDSDSRMLEGTPVYVRDTHFSWVPATIESPEDDKKRVKVRVRLPSDWEECTVIPPGRSIENIDLDRIVKLTDYPNDELPLQNIFSALDTVGKNDMADLTHLHEAAILYNLKARHKEGNPYTRVGDIMVALNPFQWIDGLYSDEKQLFYAKNLIWQASAKKIPREVSHETKDGSLSLATAATEKQALGYEYEKLGIHPHVYETSSLAFLGLARDGTDQAILVTGESGAGKTETIKIVMNHLATVERSRPLWPESDRCSISEHGSEQVVNRVIHSNPLFESFGNAKTLRNDNSSRFGKFTQLMFDVENAADAARGGRSIPSCHLVGSKCITYLLEKSRVVKVSEGERTYHIFYQLMGAPDEVKDRIWSEGLVGAETSDFSYLSSSSGSIDGLASGENWSETVDSLSIFGIHGDVFLDMMRSLCVILQLGNITFDSDIVDGEERSNISSVEALRKLSVLLGVPEADIETAMTKRFMVTRGEEFTISLKANEAKDGCDALAKEIYARVFDYLVKKINVYTEPPGTHAEYGTISLLDIFGFESFAVNRFEQLCINYANERLQQKYVNDNFQSVKTEYEGEGINVFDFSLIDNSDVVELLEGRLGLIAQLNEECVRPNGGDESFVYKLKVVNSDSSRLLQDKLHFPYEFAIRHYAAPIKYDARHFIERNLDKIPSDLLTCASKSENPFLREQFQVLLSKLEESKNTSALKKRSEATKDLVTSKFKGQLTSLMSLIEKSRTRYIRCVKPNKEMLPRILDHSLTVSQLESAGLVTAIVISRESFPNRLSYELVIERFKFLCYKFSDIKLGTGDIKIDSQILLSHLLAGITINTHNGRVPPFACGKSKVYFRVGALERIETIRQEYYAERAIQLQTWMRVRQARQAYIRLKRGMTLFQCNIRRWKARRTFDKSLRSTISLQCFIRKVLASIELKRRQREHAATMIQARWRVTKPRQHFKIAHAGIIRMQSFLRMVVCRKIYATKKKEREDETVIESRMTMIQQNFDDASTIQGTVFSVDEGLLEEVETMFEFLRKEIVTLRKKNTALKKQLAESEADKRAIYNHASSVDHSYALSKIRVEQMSKSNAALLEDNNMRRKEASKLKNELKLQQQAHEEQLNQMRADFDIALAHREMELKNLQTNHHSAVALHKREIQMIRDEGERKQEENYNEINRLRDEIKRTQDSHQDYLAKLMDVLETTQASRRIGSSPVDDDILRQKDSEISRLNEEVAMLRMTRGGHSVNGENEDVESNRKEAVKSMVYSVKKNRQQRKAHVQQLQAMISQLEESISSGHQSQVHNQVESLRDAIMIGEKSNSKMDREMVNMIDFSSMYFTPPVSRAPENFDDLIAENQKLRRKLEKKHTCKKCGHRRSDKKEDRSHASTVEDDNSLKRSSVH
eukprot:CCRYP_013082-RA/>CCRYP_013082-RA protein AED:0.07 eAED:0.07 QI:484/1/1/1/0.91/0.92/13/136/1750